MRGPSKLLWLTLLVLITAAGMPTVSPAKQAPAPSQPPAQGEGEQPPGEAGEAEQSPSQKQEEDWWKEGKQALAELYGRGKVWLRLVFYPSPEQTVSYEEVQRQVPLALKEILSDPELAPQEGAKSVMQTGGNRILFSRRMGNWELLDSLVWEVSGDWDELYRKAPLIYRHLIDRVEFLKGGILRLYIGFQTDPPRKLRLFMGPYYYVPPIELGEFLDQRAVADAKSWAKLYDLFVQLIKGDPKFSDQSLDRRLDELMMLKDRVDKALLRVVESPPKNPAQLITFVELNRQQLGGVYKSDNFKRFRDAYLYLEADLRAVESRLRELIEKEAAELDRFKFMLGVVVDDKLDRLD